MILHQLECDISTESSQLLHTLAHFMLRYENSSPRSVDQTTVTYTLDCKQLATAGQSGQQQQEGILHEGSHFCHLGAGRSVGQEYICEHGGRGADSAD